MPARRAGVLRPSTAATDRLVLAFNREKQIQNWSRAKRLALVRGDYAGLPSLAKKDFSRRSRTPE